MERDEIRADRRTFSGGDAAEWIKSALRARKEGASAALEWSAAIMGATAFLLCCADPTAQDGAAWLGAKATATAWAAACVGAAWGAARLRGWVKQL